MSPARRAAGRWRPRAGEEGSARALWPTQPDVCPALSDFYHAQYRSLFRLVVLLTGDADAAEAVVLDSFPAISQYQPRISAS